MHIQETQPNVNTTRYVHKRHDSGLKPGQPIYRRPTQPVQLSQPKKPSQPGQRKDQRLAAHPVESRLYNLLRGRRITLYLMNGAEVHRMLSMFSTFMLIVKMDDGRAVTYFKHAVLAIEFDPALLSEIEAQTPQSDRSIVPAGGAL